MSRVEEQFEHKGRAQLFVDQIPDQAFSLDLAQVGGRLACDQGTSSLSPRAMAGSLPHSASDLSGTAAGHLRRAFNAASDKLLPSRMNVDERLSREGESSDEGMLREWHASSCTRHCLRSVAVRASVSFPGYEEETSAAGASR